MIKIPTSLFRRSSSLAFISLHRFSNFRASHTTMASQPSRDVENDVDFDWEKLGFRFQQTDVMYFSRYGQDGTIYEDGLVPFKSVELNPAAGVLNYGQGVLEGLKAYRRADGKIVLFRPEENALRLIMSANRSCLLAPTAEKFMSAVKQTVLANKRWIPPTGKGSLYIRPLVLGSGSVLGLAPAPEITFVIYVSPVGNYFKEGFSAIHLQVETNCHRATPGGAGGMKVIGNYAPVLKAQRDAKEKGFSDVLYLDAIHKKYIEEVSSCNIFVVKGNKIFTPECRGTILPGITRKSIIELARMRNYKVEERLVAVDELMDADEVFCTGTIVVVSPVGIITYQEKKISYNDGVPGKVAEQLHADLTGIHTGSKEDSMGWITVLE